MKGAGKGAGEVVGRDREGVNERGGVVGGTGGEEEVGGEGEGEGGTAEVVVRAGDPKTKMMTEM